jgi:hypothetical protein
MGRIMLQALEEILGNDGARAILNLVDGFDVALCDARHEVGISFESISQLQDALEREYGLHGGRGIALRVGRACFQQGLREFGPRHGLTDLTFRLLPAQSKFQAGAAALAEIFNRYTDQRVRLEDQGKTLLWHIERCPLCWERQAEAPSCQMAVGLLQEALYWLSGGKFFRVEEISCQACGDATCTIAIDKTPMG